MERLASLIAFALGSIGWLTPARASVYVLSGGDIGEGYSPGRIVEYAYYATQPAHSQSTYTIQNVPFQPFNWVFQDRSTTHGNVNITNAFAFAAGTTAIGASADDLALRDAMGQDFLYTATPPNPNHAPWTLTLGGLTPGTVYQLDLFWHTIFTNPTTYTSTGANGPFVDTVPGLAGKYYDVRNNVIANSLGQISVVATNNTTDPDAPYLTAFSITSVPEPSALLLLGAGGLWLWWQRRSSR